ncbi:MAG: hypothetical protein FJX67_16445 [Alphaproteobacteria bacterium]|nr:hypothetical protein [Alphaproteobacteria bacterium]
MRVYTVHYRPLSLAADRETVLVREGFHWPAFLAGLAPAVLIADAVPAAGVVLVGLALAAGLGLNDLRRHRLARQGYAEAVVAAANPMAALRRFLDLRDA